MDAIEGLLSRYSGRPWSLAAAGSALFLPVSVALFIEHRELFFRLGVPGTLLISAGVSLPFILALTSVFYVPLSAIARHVRARRGEREEDDFERVIRQDDPLEAPCLFGGASVANIVLYAITFESYRRELDLARTYVTTGAIVVGFALLVMLVTIVGVAAAARAHGVENSGESA